MPTAKVATYNGILGLLIRNYTTTYNNIQNAWSWNSHSLLPMDYTAYKDGGGAFLGMQANVFDLATGISSFKVGVQTGSLDISSFGTPIPFNNRMQMFFNQFFTTQQLAVFCDFGFTLGSNVSYASMIGTVVFDTGGGANTGTPDPRCSNNWQTIVNVAGHPVQDAVYTSGEISLDQFYMQANGAGLFTKSVAPFDMGFAPGNGFDGCIPYKNYNWVRQGGFNILHQTNFVDVDNQFTVTLQNPPGSFDVNAWVQGNAGLFNATNQGWCATNSATETVAGRTMNGFVILIAPDFSSYVIFDIIPTDAASAGWNGGAPGGYPGPKFDNSGHLFLHQANDNRVINISTGIVPLYRVLPVFPPIALPDPIPDTEIPLLLYEGKS